MPTPLNITNPFIDDFDVLKVTNNKTNKEQLKGTIDKILFQSDSFMIAILRDKDGIEYKIKGDMLYPQFKIEYTLTGKNVTHSKYGDSFAFTDFKASYPREMTAIRDYLIENCKWIGEAISTKIVNEFKEKTIEICKNNPKEVAEKISGITFERAKTISDMLKANENNEEMMIKLKEITANTSISKRAINQIITLYKDNSVSVIQNNPYGLIDSVEGVGFLTADKLARQVHIKIDSPVRIKAGVIYSLKESGIQGHTMLPESDLYENTAELLKIHSSIVTIADIKAVVNTMIEEKLLILDNGGISLPELYNQEKEIAVMLKKLLEYKPEIPKEINESELKQDQIEALHKALGNSVFILCGSPGVGKTFLIKRIIETFSDMQIALASPTGKAAKRMTEMTGMDASTIHKLLEPMRDPTTNQFRFGRDENFPIEAKLIIIDEVSMVPIYLMYHLLKAIREGTIVIFVGDSFQLASVGAGNILKDMIASKEIPHYELTEIKRQEPGLIITNCHRIKNGQDVIINNGEAIDFFFVAEDTPEEIQDTIIELVSERLPAKYGIDPLKDLQILSPLREKTLLSCKELNKLCQKALNPRHLGEKMRFKIEDKLIQKKNDYGKGIVNGDVGFLKQFTVDKTMLVTFSYPDRIVELPIYDNELELAYCITCHSFEGSESDIIIMPIHSCLGSFIPDRNWIYTAISRAKKVCILVGDIMELSKMVRRNRQGKRFTNLEKFLKI